MTEEKHETSKAILVGNEFLRRGFNSFALAFLYTADGNNYWYCEALRGCSKEVANPMTFKGVTRDEALLKAYDYIRKEPIL